MNEQRKKGPPTKEHLSYFSWRVLRTAAELTPKLMDSHTEVIDLYKESDLSQVEIAKQVAPEVAEQYPNAGKVAVGNVLRELLPKEEHQKITAGRRSERLNRRLHAMSEEEYKTHQSKAAKARQQKNPTNPEDLTRARGMIPWTELERSFAFFLRTQDEYLHQDGPHKGHPNRSKIAQALNDTFHQRKPIRSKDGIQGLFSDPRFKK